MDKQHILTLMKQNAAQNHYYLCSDPKLLDTLLEGLVSNYQRYGYASCPCRIASGDKTYDSDIICPCEYRDADVDEYGMCYCGLFVNREKYENPQLLAPIPERRPVEIQDAALKMKPHAPRTPMHGASSSKTQKNISVYRCTVCGYLCARETPPPLCPICKAKAERFELFYLTK
ncbi:MAG: ferredoxin-thioredoxin reductase catalytic domain-containing protein [Candidatus Thermoplasmatota archaeon]